MTLVQAVVREVYGAQEWRIQITPEAQRNFTRYVQMLRQIPGVKPVVQNQGGRYYIWLYRQNAVFATISFYPDWRIREVMPDPQIFAGKQVTPLQTGLVVLTPDQLRDYVTGLLNALGSR
jgi:hypothetical protein